MSFDYRKPGVYVSESLLVGTGDVGNANTTALFAGVAPSGPVAIESGAQVGTPVRCETWSDYVANFGSVTTKAKDPAVDGSSILSYLPYAVYNYFQNGGRPCYVQRAVNPSSAGTAASATVYDTPIAISNRARATTTVTITTSAPHGLAVDDVVQVDVTKTGDDANNALLSGVQTVTTVADSTHFTYEVGTSGTIASAASTGTVKHASFTVTAKNAAAPVATLEGGTEELAVTLATQGTGVYVVIILKGGVEVERFTALSLDGSLIGTKQLDTAINDPLTGSALVRVSSFTPVSAGGVTITPAATTAKVFSGGVDPGLPTGANIKAALLAAVSVIEGPLLVNVVGYVKADGTYLVPTAPTGSEATGRTDVFVIKDSLASRATGGSVEAYKASMITNLPTVGDSYVAGYGPWIITADPASSGTITVPPGGSVAGTYSRIDSTIGVFRAPAGIVATLQGVLGVDTKFTDSQLGELNNANVNVIRPVAGAGIAIMGARTGKQYGADRYVSARRTLIYIKESLRRSTQFALFENNDQRLWSMLTMTAERVLRPLWEEGGLRGASAAEAYFIKCDASINTPAVINSGEVRMDVGVALEIPAEFIVIRVSQFESTGSITAEVLPNG